MNSIFQAALKKDEPAVIRLLQAGQHPDSRGGEGNETALTAAVRFLEDDGIGIYADQPSMTPRLSIVNLLLSAGADVNAKDDYGRTALHYNLVAFNDMTGNVIAPVNVDDIDRVTDALLRAGAIVNAKDRMDTTPLWLAVFDYKLLGTIRLLLKAGADVESKTIGGGTTALMIATSYRNVEIIKELLDAGANVNAQNEEGSTALAYCGYPRHPTKELDISAGLTLLSRGADPTIKNNEGKTASQNPGICNTYKSVLLSIEKKLTFSRKCVGKMGLQLACKQSILKSICGTNKVRRNNIRGLNLPLPLPLIDFLLIREDFEDFDDGRRKRKKKKKRRVVDL